MAVMCASFCKLVRPNEKTFPATVWCILGYESFLQTGEYDKRSASSIVNYRWENFFAQKSILVPDNELLLKYNDLSGNMYQMILKRSVKIEKAKKVRNRLLQKLMSGELEVWYIGDLFCTTVFRCYWKSKE